MAIATAPMDIARSDVAEREPQARRGPIILPALPREGGALVPVEPSLRLALLRGVEAAGLAPFLRLAQLYPTVAQGILLPLVAMLVMCFALGGVAVFVVAAYFIGCGVILSRKAVGELVDRLDAAGGSERR